MPDPERVTPLQFGLTLTGSGIHFSDPPWASQSSPTAIDLNPFRILEVINGYKVLGR